MASATITRPAPGPDPATGRRTRWASWPALLLGALALGTLIGFVVYPTFPNYDSYYSLLWGRELLHGVKPSFDASRAPTEHPLAVAFGAVLSIVGDPADRIMVGATLASFVVLAARPPQEVGHTATHEQVRTILEERRPATATPPRGPI